MLYIELIKADHRVGFNGKQSMSLIAQHLIISHHTVMTQLKFAGQSLHLHQLMDILADRTQHHLRDYFLR